jgi:hypothetical protein
MGKKQTMKDARTNRYRKPYLRHRRVEELRKTGLGRLPPSLRQYETRGGCPIGRKTCGVEISQRREESDTKERRCDDGENGSGGWRREVTME